VPIADPLRAAALEAAECTACDLHAAATQTVFGEGPVHAPLFLIGEQPGDQEDQLGRPFVGPAGRVFDDALAAAGIDRDATYVTNAVKHFKWTAKGKRRLHERPNRTEIVACHGWLLCELSLVEPDVVVALGAVAGQSLWGPSFRVGAAHGNVLEFNGRPAIATIHPSAVLRARDGHARKVALDGLVADLRSAARLQRTRSTSKT
jgi:DNA polymerase